MEMYHRLTPAAIWIIALIGFVAVAALAGAHDTFAGDVWLAQQFQDMDWPVLASTLEMAEELGSMPTIVLVWVGAAVLVAAAIGRRQALLLAAAAVLRFSNAPLKEIVGRPRPSLELVSAEHQPSSLSFPSGHAQTVILLYGLLFYFAAVYIKDGRLRALAQVFCAWVIVFTGMERVYAGHHWPSDVVGGFWLGGLILAALIAIDQLVLRRQGNSVRERGDEPLGEAQGA